jgi:methyltransferase (TIGR00027 family)
VPEQRASRTAVVVCQGRAAAHDRAADRRFADPTAMAMLHDDEQVPVEQVRAGRPPSGFTERAEYEMVRAGAEVMVPRTVAIDEAVRARAAGQVVIVGAGLDGRAWRMPELSTVDVFEVDQPASQEDKRKRVGQLPALAQSLSFVPVDFTRDRLDTALAAAGHQADRATTWIWEGVVPYLSRTDVATTLRAIRDRSAPGSRLIINYQAPSALAAVGRGFARGMSALSGRGSLWANEPRRSTWTPAAIADLLSRNGFRVVQDDDLLTLAGSGTVRNRRSLQSGRVVVADRLTV